MKKYIIATVTIALVFALLLTSCSPGPGVYEGHITGEHVVVLPEGREYVVYFEANRQGGTGSSWSTTGRASWYPELDGIVVVRDEDGNTIPNTMDELYNYGSGDRWGITVARFELEGKGTRSVELHTDMDAYRRFQSAYRERDKGTPFGAGNTPDPIIRVVIRQVSGFMIPPSNVIFILISCGIIGYLIYRIRYRKERGGH